MTRRRWPPGAAALVVLALALTAMPTPATGQSGGRRNCDRLSSQDFERIGERVMGRMLGSPGAHRSMDELMAQMMGGANEQRMHEVMGERFTGCGNPALPGGYAGMMGTMGMMGGLGSAGGGASLAPGGAYGPGGSMMGLAARRGNSEDDDDDVPVGWMIAMMLVLVGGAGAAAYAFSRQGRGSGDPSRLLALRFARGEIDADEYRRLSERLEGAR